MLGKLLKYELKADYLKFGILYAITLITAILINVINSYMQSSYNPLSEIVLTGLSGVLNFSYVVAFVMVFVIAITRFAKTVMKDEGYLFHTLPVPTWQLILSKLIVMYIWSAATVFVIFFCIVMVDYNFNFALFFRDNFGGEFNDPKMTFYSLYMTFIAPFMVMSQVYFSCAIGNLSNKSKTGVATAVFFGIYIIQQALGGILIVYAVSKGIMKNADFLMKLYESGWTLPIGMILPLFFPALFYYFANRIFTKKLNLE